MNAGAMAAETMAAAAQRLLGHLDDEARAVVCFAFADEDARHDWHYIPRTRPGLALTAMGAPAQKAAHDLVATALSLPAFAAATTIMGLEDVLDRVEGGGRSRHRGDYSVTVFDEPAPGSTWGWRFEGHHVSVNVAVVDGEVASTPLFLGANPAEVLSPSRAAVTRPLGGEEDLALDLMASLSGPQRSSACLAEDAPDDILTTNAVDLDDVTGTAEGVRFADLAGSAPAAARALVDHYLDRLPGPQAEAWRCRLQPGFGDIRFAFAGEMAYRRPHYYRIAGATLFVECDNTQNEANHVHTVLRDPGRDFGRDLLREHRASHHGAPQD